MDFNNNYKQPNEKAQNKMQAATNSDLLATLRGRAKAGLLAFNGRPHAGGLRPMFNHSFDDGLLRITSHHDFGLDIDFDKVVGACLDAVRPSCADTNHHSGQFVDVDVEASSCSLVLYCRIRDVVETRCIAAFEFDFEDDYVAVRVSINAMDDDVDRDMAAFWFDICI